MRVALVGQDLAEVEELLSARGLERDDISPEVVISVGGDGTLLWAERDYPGVPKLPMRASETSRKTHNHGFEELLDKLAADTLVEIPQMKLVAESGGRKLYALNDIIFHNAAVTSAVRYRVEINGRLYSDEIIGDGLIVATPFGSTAYYRSITHSLFEVGIGLAFNNTIEPVDHLVLRDCAEIQVTVLRGPALVAADNDPETISLSEGESFTVRKAREPARILSLPEAKAIT